jgi:hypothetical protein
MILEPLHEEPATCGVTMVKPELGHMTSFYCETNN